MNSTRSSARLAIALALVLTASAATPAAPAAEPDVVTRRAVCRWADKPPVLDGKLDDPALEGGRRDRPVRLFWDEDRPGRGRPGLPGLGRRRPLLRRDDDRRRAPRRSAPSTTTASGTATSSSCSSSRAATGPTTTSSRPTRVGASSRCLPRRGTTSGLRPKLAPLGTQGRGRGRRHARPPGRPRPGLDRRGPDPLDGLRPDRRQAQARRRLALRPLPLRLRPAKAPSRS